MGEQLDARLLFRHFPVVQPDPASLLQFFVEIEQPAVRQAAFAAFLQMSLEQLQAQTKFVGALQKAMGPGR